MRPDTKLLCTIQGIKMEFDGKEVLLIKNPIPTPFYKAKDGMGMLGFLEKLRKRVLIVPLTENPFGELIADWPATMPEEIRRRAIEPSDLTLLNIYEDGEVESNFGNS